MSWEKSKCLTPLKHDFLIAFFKLHPDFYLTGGSALGIFYLEHRLSYDLDLFTNRKVDWHLLLITFQEICKSINCDFVSITKTPLFQRYKIMRKNEQEIIDFVIEEVPSLNDEKKQFDMIRVDSIEEIGINKICTLVSRFEIKDLIDLYFLSKNGFNIIDHIEKAKKKEVGLEAAILSYLLDQFNLNDLPEYLIKPLSLDELLNFKNNLKRDLANLSFPKKYL